MTAALLFFVTLSASAEQFGPIQLSVLTSISDGALSGYNERRFEIVNPSGEPHDVELTIVTPGYAIRAEVRVRRRFVVPPRATIEAAVPEMLIGWAPPRQLLVSVDGRHRSPDLTLPSSNNNYRSVIVLLSRNLPDTRLAAEVKKRGMSPNAYEFTRTSVPPRMWSTNWLAYTTYGGIAMTAGDWGELPAAAQTAILRWVRSGGTLLINGGEIALPEAYGVEFEGDYTRSHVGFGDLINVPGTLEDVDEELFGRFVKACAISSSMVDVSDTPPLDSMPLLGEKRMPVGAIFTMLLLFAVLAGPLSLFLLARRERRLWIFWTLPLLATLTGCGVIATAVISEGWQRVNRTASVTYLDENSGEATTLGLTGVYTTLPPDGQMRFSSETEIRPYARDGVLELDATDGQQLLAGWVDSRVSTYFAFRKPERRRERLLLQAHGASIGAVNGFGSRIVKLWVAQAESGRIFEADNVEPGAHVTLHETSLTTSKPLPELTLGSPDHWPSWPERLRNDPRGVLRPGMYVAVLQSSPFADAPLQRPATYSAPGVVIGISKVDLNHAN